MASSISPSQKYDLFPNFSGEDVRFGFLSNLMSYLQLASVVTFLDTDLERGEEIKLALMYAIQDSKVSLAIFSEGYASSSWALDELVMIMECKKHPTLNQKVIPIFYHVDPSHVRNQSGVFAEDFAKNERDPKRRDKVPQWRAAMAAAAGLSGRSVTKTSSEADVLKQIVNDVLKFLGRKPLEILLGKLKDCSIVQQRQGERSIWTFSRSHGIHEEDLDTALTSLSIRIGVRGKPSEPPLGQTSEASNSQPSPPIPNQYGVNYYGLGGTMAPISYLYTINYNDLESFLYAVRYYNLESYLYAVNYYDLSYLYVVNYYDLGVAIALPWSSSIYTPGDRNNKNNSPHQRHRERRLFQNQKFRQRHFNK